MFKLRQRTDNCRRRISCAKNPNYYLVVVLANFEWFMHYLDTNNFENEEKHLVTDFHEEKNYYTTSTCTDLHITSLT